MSKYHSYLNSSASVITNYVGTIPLSSFLKEYFKKNKKFGSRDRKEISALVYQYYRLGHYSGYSSIEERIICADFICRGSASAFVQHLRPDWINKDDSLQKNRLEVTDIKWNENVHTPWINRLTRHIDHSMFAWSHLLQPDLFIRIRPGKKEKVINALEGKQIRWKDEQYDCIRLPVQTKLDEILTLNRDAVVQDLSSSQCGLVIKECIPKIEGWVWDVCAASGGKSILLNDLYPGKIKLIVSDIRPSILSNLQKRFLEAGVNAGYHFVADHLSITHPKRALPPVEVLLIDAPCTGSGTWARTPEQHYFFKDSCIQDYADKQFNICLNVFDQLKANGYLIYITCSVFEDENEKVVEKLLSQKPLRLVHSQYIDGTQRRSDSMFIAILQKD